jgi:hypothetical protein
MTHPIATQALLDWGAAASGQPPGKVRQRLVMKLDAWPGTADPYRNPMIPTYTCARRTCSRQYPAGRPAPAGKYSMSSTASPARMTACSAAATNDRPAGKARSSEV